MAEARRSAMTAPSTSTSASLKDYLKRYESADQGHQKKKKKKKTSKNSAARGVLIVDEDPIWGKPVIPDAEEEPEAEETPVVDEDVEVKRMRRLELLRSRKPYHSLSEDGSGWVSIANTSTRAHSPSGEISPDLSPRRRRNSAAHDEDLSPRRRNSSPPDEDLSPPRRRRSSPSAEANLSPPRRRRHSPPQNEDISPPRRRKNVASEDLSPPRRRSSTRTEDLSPPRRRKNIASVDLSPLRRNSSTLSEDLSPPRKRRNAAAEDLSPPRRKPSAQREDFSSLRRRKNVASEDLSPSRRKSSTHTDDLSPPRRGKNPSEDLSPPRRKPSTQSEDISPPRRRKNVPSEDLSPPRKRRNGTPVHSPRRERKSMQKELSPRRDRRSAQEDFSLSRLGSSPLRESKKKQPTMKEERRAGLFTGREIKEEIDRKKEEEASRFNALDPSLSGRGAEPVYRDKEGKRISKEEMMKTRQVEEKPKEKKIEWGKGLVQKREAETKVLELELEKEKPFARSRDDPELDKMLRERARWGDPMAHLIKKKQPLDLAMEDLGEDEKMKESGFIIPQGIPIHSWLKRGVDPPVNRYGIRPGRHWDGVDRSNGFEKQMFQRQNERRATETEAYLWSVSDM